MAQESSRVTAEQVETVMEQVRELCLQIKKLEGARYVLEADERWALRVHRLTGNTGKKDELGFAARRLAESLETIRTRVSEKREALEMMIQDAMNGNLS